MVRRSSIEHIAAQVRDPEKSETVFRAITCQTGRHGMKLEKAYWDSLEMISSTHGMKPAGIIDLLAASETNEKRNLTAAVRVFCLLWHSRFFSECETIGGERLATSLVHASMQPAIALSSKKRLLASNEALLKLIRMSFGAIEQGAEQTDLRLALDHPLEEVIGQLREKDNLPMQVGMAMGLADKRLRRNLNAVLIPSTGSDILVGYVL